VITCPQCGAEHLPNTLFCDRCGESLWRSESSDRAQENDSPRFRLQIEVPATGCRDSLSLVDDILIGRADTDTAPRPDVDLAVCGEAALSVSRRHARVRLVGARVQIEDLGSTNGTRVGKRWLTPGQPVFLPESVPCDLRVGAVRLRLRLVREK